MQEHQCVDGNVRDIEMWADIRGYEGRYQVSTLGRVKSLARVRKGKNNSVVAVPERVMALSLKKKSGRTMPYTEVRLRNGSSRTVPAKSFLVHRLVADAFIRPLQEGDQVDHINGGHSDNRVENLRVMHYTEHGRHHPLIASGTLSTIGLASQKEMRKRGWVNPGYVRTAEHIEKARRQAFASPAPRDLKTGRFV